MSTPVASCTRIIFWVAPQARCAEVCVELTSKTCSKVRSRICMRCRGGVWRMMRRTASQTRDQRPVRVRGSAEQRSMKMRGAHRRCCIELNLPARPCCIVHQTPGICNGEKQPGIRIELRNVSILSFDNDSITSCHVFNYSINDNRCEKTIKKPNSKLGKKKKKSCTISAMSYTRAFQKYEHDQRKEHGNLYFACVPAG